MPRKTAFEILLRFEKGGANRLKADSLIQQAAPEADRPFVTALAMGTLRHWLRLDEWIKHLTHRSLKQIDPNVRVLLRMGLFQLYGLHQVPAYAAINTTVELARQLKQSDKTVKFINAVLREAQRRLEAGGFVVPAWDENPEAHLLRAYGWPEAFTQRLLKQFGAATLMAMAQAAQHPAPLTLRVNTLKTALEGYTALLNEVGIPYDTLPDLPEGILLSGFSGSPRQLPGYEEGLFYVQDPASMAVSLLLNPDADETVLDLCAAPGSKSTHMAALMCNTGRITAIEPKAERAKLLRENLDRLGVRNTNVREANALTLELPDEQYDKVLVDAPCSGSGTLRRHPEILLQLRKPDLSQYTHLQGALLEKGFALLKPGGRLVYSTCSILDAENAQVVSAFLKKHPDAVLESQEQKPITDTSDGFYMALLRKA